MTEENKSPDPAEEPTPDEQTPEETAKTPSRLSKVWLPVGAVAVVAVLVGALVLTSTGDDEDTAADGEETSRSDGVSTHQDEVLVTAEWLEDNLDNPDVVVVEVSENRPGSGLTAYEEGHVPGAVEFVWTDHFTQQVTRDIVDQDGFTELARDAGIDDDSTVVLYGDANNWFAAWGAWVFKHYGAQDVRLLDGGRNKWEEEDRPLDNVAPSPDTGTFTASEPDTGIRAFQPDVLEVAQAEDAASADADLIDIRGPEEYNGEIAVAEGFDGEAAVKLGHIPNAVNVPWAGIVNEDGTYLPADEIAEVYAEAGVDGSRPVIVYCRIGERASHTWYALSQILGYDVQLYDGSWTEWGNSVGVPIQNNSSEERSGLWS